MQDIVQDQSEYLTDVNEIVSYLELGGMFFIQDGNKLSLYDNINEDIFTYKKYDLKSAVKINEHGLIEVELNTNDTTLMGSASFTTPLKEIISKYHISVNNFKIKKNAYQNCQLDVTCSDLINVRNEQIVQTLVDRLTTPEMT